MFLEARKFFFIKMVLVYCCTIERVEKTAGKISAACGQDCLISHFLFVVVVSFCLFFWCKPGTLNATSCKLNAFFAFIQQDVRDRGNWWLFKEKLPELICIIVLFLFN